MAGNPLLPPIFSVAPLTIFNCPAAGVVWLAVNVWRSKRPALIFRLPPTVTLLPSVTLPPVLVLLIVRLLKLLALFVKVCTTGLPPLPLKIRVLPVSVNVPALLSEPVSESWRLVIFSVPPALTVTESTCRLFCKVVIEPLITVIVLVGVMLPVPPALLMACVPVPRFKKPPVMMPSSVRSLAVPPPIVRMRGLVIVSVRPLARFKLKIPMSVAPIVGSLLTPEAGMITSLTAGLVTPGA